MFGADVAEAAMTPELARTCIYSFFWQIAQHQDRRILMSPHSAALHKAQTQATEQRRALTLLESVYAQAARFFTDRKREDHLQGAGQDALAQQRVAVGQADRFRHIEQEAGHPLLRLLRHALEQRQSNQYSAFLGWFHLALPSGVGQRRNRPLS